MTGETELRRFLLLYGSQTGQAQAIAEEFRERAIAVGLNPDLQCMQGADSKFSLEREQLAVIALSTTGDGEAPDSARKLIRRLRKRTLTKDYLKNLRYALLALGDSNYMNFANCGKEFERRLRELGARPLHDTCCADDAVGLEVAVDPWLVSILITLLKHFQLEVPTYLSNPVDMPSDVSDGSTLEKSASLGGIELNLPSLPENYLQLDFQEQAEIDLNKIPLQNDLAFPSAASETFESKLIDVKKFTHSSKVKEYIQLTFELTDPDISYQPGDAFGIICQNDPSEVDAILELLGLTGKANFVCKISSSEINRNVPFHLPTTATLRHILITCCDIRSPPKKNLLRAMAEYTVDEHQKRRLLELCSRQGSNEFLKFIRAEHLSILDLLKGFPSCTAIPIEVLLENLPRLNARFYSVANSPITSSNKFVVVFSVVNFKSGCGRYGDRKGVCTGFLTNTVTSLKICEDNPNSVEDLTTGLSNLCIEVNNKFQVFKRISSQFILPNDNSVPLIMIGPGTGVAPFLGFLQHREALCKSCGDATGFGETWLFFGCRHKEHDFLFEKELFRLHYNGTLTQLRLSFSRDSDCESHYVQDCIRKDFDSLLNLIENEKAIVFVCGDAKNMAKDVAKAFIDCYQLKTNVSMKEATLWHAELQKSKRYVQDLWL